MTYANAWMISLSFQREDDAVPSRVHDATGGQSGDVQEISALPGCDTRQVLGQSSDCCHFSTSALFFSCYEVMREFFVVLVSSEATDH